MDKKEPTDPPTLRSRRNVIFKTRTPKKRVKCEFDLVDDRPQNEPFQQDEIAGGEALHEPEKHDPPPSSCQQERIVASTSKGLPSERDGAPLTQPSSSSTHSESGSYKCSVCSKSFVQKSHLDDHKCTHGGEKPFKCSLCGSNFARNCLLSSHMRLHKEPFKCDCGMAFTRKSELNQHKSIHTGQKLYTCPVCDKIFSHLSLLQIHTLTHPGYNPHKCTVCNASFSQLEHYKRHILLHTSEKLFKCDQCDAAFNMKSHLNRHTRTHTGEKPFECNQCNAAFS